MATKNSSIAQSKKAVRHTMVAYNTLDVAFDFFNRQLFGNVLPPCLITFRGQARTYGYFSGGRFARAHQKGSGVQVDEIAMNPQHMAERTPETILSTLVHEQCHSWQHHHGKKPTRCYHDKQFAAKMKEVGLYPSNTGEPGGKETGPQMTHYIIKGGPFATACAAFLKKNETALYQDLNIALAKKPKGGAKKKSKDDDDDGDDEIEKSPGRIKFTCFGCELNAWAKPSANLRCGDCDRPMKPAEAP